jgi:hypothetical protein
VTILIAENPEINSYVASLIEAYENKGHIVFCSHHNFFSSNMVPDLLHIRWTERLYNWNPYSEKPVEEKLEILEERLKWYKAKGTVIVMTLCNYLPKRLSSRSFEDMFLDCLVKFTDIFCHHCTSSSDLLKELFPISGSKLNIVNSYGGMFTDYENISRESARQILNIPQDRFVILSPAAMKTTKEEIFVNAVFKSVSAKKKYLLRIGNYEYNDLEHFKKYISKLRNRIREKNPFSSRKYIYRSIREKEIPLIYNASDVVFAGDNEEFASTIISTAATYAKPVIYPKVGCFEEQTKGWVSIPYQKNNIYQASEAINDMFKRLYNKKITLNNELWLKENSPDGYVEKILQKVPQVEAH